MRYGDNYISENSVRKAAERIHEASDCNNKNEYSIVYGSMVTFALNILL